MAKEIFISYSRKDFDKVKAIKDEIDREVGIDCWMDLDGIESGEQFKKVIIKAINEHDTFLFMLSTSSMASPYALKELGFAANKRKRVILVFIEPCQMTDDFLFDYQDYDNIDWNNTLQHNKLLGNLHKWFPGSLQREETIQSVAEKTGARIFISYKRADKDKVFPLKDQIEAAIGEPCWMDLDGIESDASFVESTIRSINAAEIFLFMYSKHQSDIKNYSTDWAIRELNYAIKNRKHIVFVNLDGTPLARWFAYMFPQQQQVDATNPDRLNKLIKDIKKWLDIPTNEQPDIHDHQTDESHVITPPEPEIEGDIFPVEVGGTTFNMIRVEGGEMEIGATAEQGKEAEKNEYPAHRIVCQTFYMSQFPITQNLWESVMGYNKAKYKEKEDKLSSDLEELKRTLGVSTLTTAALLALPAGLLMSAGLAYGANKARKWLAENLGDDTAKFGNVKGHYPIENITYEEALEFVNRLSQMTHLQFSLPTEDEWEYAARGGRQSRGTKYAGSNSIDEVAWYRDNADGTTHPVGEKKPNELGLYDMCGNVWEWTETPAHSYGLKIEVGGDVYIRRGGSWWHEAQNCRVSRRYPTSRAKKTSGLGIRVVIRGK